MSKFTICACGRLMMITATGPLTVACGGVVFAEPFCRGVACSKDATIDETPEKQGDSGSQDALANDVSDAGCGAGTSQDATPIGCACSDGSIPWCMSATEKAMCLCVEIAPGVTRCAWQSVSCDDCDAGICAM